MSKQDVNKDYNQAVQSLKQLNNELFYNDLKTRMTDSINRYEESFDKSTEALEKMEMMTQRLPSALGEELKKVTELFILNSSDAVENTTKKVEDIFHNREQVLKNMSAHFEKILQNYVKLQGLSKSQVEEQLNALKEYVENEKNEWKQHRQELMQLLTSLIKENNKTTTDFFQTKIDSIDNISKRHQSSLNTLLDDVTLIKDLLKNVESNVTNRYSDTVQTVIKEFKELNSEQTRNLQTLETTITEKLHETEHVQQEISLSLQEVAMTQAQSQQQLVEAQFLNLMETNETTQRINEKKHRFTFRVIVGLAVGEAVIIAIQLIALL
ncbi:hypothetical protein [Bacillus solitudinis]|uniref:hypothetical protein n=1 Tax=Bacillus solitudinis TaxID=2014074 RepID=UPI000C24AF9B|nr:hypothetical protein [Bacillus solitudinis]